MSLFCAQLRHKTSTGKSRGRIPLRHFRFGINPRPASASRALLRLTPCHRAYRRTTQGGTSGTPDSLELTGGEYKARERIHRNDADLRLLAIPTSWGRVAALNPNWGCFYKDLLHLTVLRPVVATIVSRVQPRVSEGHADLASSPPSSPVRELSRLTLVTGNGGCVRFPT